MHDELRSCLDRGLLFRRPVEPCEHKAAQMTPLYTGVEQDPVGDTLALAQKPEAQLSRIATPAATRHALLLLDERSTCRD